MGNTEKPYQAGHQPSPANRHLSPSPTRSTTWSEHRAKMESVTLMIHAIDKIMYWKRDPMKPSKITWWPFHPGLNHQITAPMNLHHQLQALFQWHTMSWHFLTGTISENIPRLAGFECLPTEHPWMEVPQWKLPWKSKELLSGGMVSNTFLFVPSAVFCFVLFLE